jgi:sarcosine oxidase subunit beta
MTADVYLVASGAWSAKVLSFAGINFPVKFTHAEAMITEPLLPVLNHHISLSGFYQSVHQGNFTVGLGVGQHRRGSLLISNAIRKMEEVGNTSTAWSMPALAKAVLEILPCLVNCSVLRSWAAPSPFLPDHKPALGWLPGFENLYITAGFHLAIPTIPLLCEAAANEITTGDRSSLLQDFQPGRFAKMDLSDQTRTDHT